MEKEKEQLLGIDLAILEEECTKQPRMVWQWGDDLAKARKAAKEAKAHFELVESKLSIRIRQDPEGHGLEKATDKAVEAATVSDETYQNAQDAWIQAEFEVDSLKAMVDALNDRRTELENLVKLHGQQYFSKPAASPEARQAVEEESRVRSMRGILPKKR